LHQQLFYTVMRAGLLIGGNDHHIDRNHFPGHEIILCLRGQGYVRIAGRTHAVAPGDLVWVDCGFPHQHGPVVDNPWEVLWIRGEGLRLSQIAQSLGIEAQPVFPGMDVALLQPVYENIFQQMRSTSASAPAWIHAGVSQLIAAAFAQRQDQPSTPLTPPVLLPAIEQMRLFFFHHVRVSDLAQRCGLSESHFNRLFRAAMGTSPIDWLRRERITNAKRRLVESDEPVKRIAEQVGYHDRFFFSRDFKQVTGQTPTEFRNSERSLVALRT
jgi:AraC-like DNA-binding protein